MRANPPAGIPWADPTDAQPESALNLVDGRPADHLPLDEPALGTGMAVYEALRTYGGRPFRVSEHLRRLRDSAAWFGFACAADAVFAAEIERVVDGISGEVAVFLMLTGGGRRVVRSRPLDLARVGAAVRVATLPWEPPPWLPGWVKHTNRAGWQLAAQKAGVDEVLFVDTAGHWTEANRSNLFVVRSGTLCTPPDDGRILRGVTRGALIEGAVALGIPVLEEAVTPGEADEIYLSSTLKGLVPIVEVDGRKTAGTGPVGDRVRAAFHLITGGHHAR